MIEKNMPLVYWYEKALRNEDIHMCTSMELTNIDASNLFEDNNALQFIRNYFESLRSSYALKSPAHKFLEVLDRITEFRAQHTVASFLLGVVMKEELSLDTRDWIRIYDIKSSNASFGFFWSLICLTHDVAYNWERNSKKMIAQVSTVEAFCQYNEIQYNLLNEAENAELIRNYYRYRAAVSEKIDHGIAGAILIYDALMTFYYEGIQIPSLNLCGLQLRKNFPDFCLRIAETVALHNMWRATDKTIDTYREYHLDELIPDGSGREVVFYKDDMLLFLLGFIDTIDPIKGFCSTEGRRVRLSVDDVLNNFCIQFVKRGKMKKIYMEFANSNFNGKYTTDIAGMDNWLGVSVKQLTHDKVEISIRMDSMEQLERDSRPKSA